MNCPSRTDEPPRDAKWNQNPQGLAADLTTRQDLNGMVNLRTDQDSCKEADDDRAESDGCNANLRLPPKDSTPLENFDDCRQRPMFGHACGAHTPTATSNPRCYRRDGFRNSYGKADGLARTAWRMLAKFGKFIGPGFIISVAYIDPGNYSTDVAAGAATRFSLLFIVLLSNIFAIVLQSLAVRLGTVTGMNLAEHCRAHLPRWLNFILYIFGEAAIIATDTAEVIGSAIALNLLLKIPLVAGCAITLLDVLVILIFYSPNGSMRRLRAFEYFVMALVLGVVICFCIQLSLISTSVSVGSVFAGYLPSSSVVRGQGIYLSCGILGATVMPHSLYLGSGMVQSRLREFDKVQPPSPPTASRTMHNTSTLRNTTVVTKADIAAEDYRPSLAAINHCLTYSIAEVSIALFTFALFVNSAILIVAGASLYTPNDSADTNSLFSIHDLLSSTLAPAAGTIFALALLLSGTSAGIVCTIAGQMLSEGALNWSIKPWLRRLLTRSISITPSIIVAGAVGKPGLSAALNGSQVALSVILPVVSAPLIYFTCRNKYMIVGGRDTTYPRPSNPSRRMHAANAAPSRGSTAFQAASSGTAVNTDREAGDPTTSRATSNEYDIEVRPGQGNARVSDDGDGDGDVEEVVVKMRNHIWVSVLAIAIWFVIAIMNVALLVLVGLGQA